MEREGALVEFLSLAELALVVGRDGQIVEGLGCVGMIAALRLLDNRKFATIQLHCIAIFALSS